jgi:hypothetical protein
MGEQKASGCEENNQARNRVQMGPEEENDVGESEVKQRNLYF